MSLTAPASQGMACSWAYMVKGRVRARARVRVESAALEAGPLALGFSSRALRAHAKEAHAPSWGAAKGGTLTMLLGEATPE